MNAKKFLVFNWKMNGGKEYAVQIKKRMNNIHSNHAEAINKNFHIILCPPIVFSSIFDYNDDIYSIGAQNCAFETFGSYTGEISPMMLKEIGIKYVILGHSERRKYFDENERIILNKMDKALESNLIPIICVYNFEKDKQYIANVIDGFLNHKSSKDLVIAYEPEFSIGSGISDSIDSIKHTILCIKNIFKNRNIENKNIYVIYGGSVSDENFLNIIKVCDGVLIGKMSLDYKAFNNILEKLKSLDSSC